MAMDWQTRVREIVDRTNREIKYTPDRPDKNNWQPHGLTEMMGTGDCEDIQLLTRSRLIKAGLVTPEDARLLIGHDKRLGDHMVLGVKGADGKRYYIDNVNGFQKKYDDFTVTRELGLVGWWDIQYPL